MVGLPFGRNRPKFKKIFEKGRKKVGNFRIFLKRLKTRKIAENMQKPRPRTIGRNRQNSADFPDFPEKIRMVGLPFGRNRAKSADSADFNGTEHYCIRRA